MENKEANKALLAISDKTIKVRALDGFHIFKAPLKKIIRLDKLNEIYTGINSEGSQNSFLDELLESLHVRYNISDNDSGKIPENGPLLVVANHPFGGIDGIILSRFLLSVRQDVRVMANYFLKSIPELSSLFIAVDPFGRKDSIKANAKPLREALKWLKDGGVLCVFPAGEVSHVNIRKGVITDPRWSPMIARLVRKAGAQVLPVYFTGHNSVIFQCMGMVHPIFRTIMLPGEMLRNRDGETIDIKVGNSISIESLARFRSDEDVTAFLRLKTYMLRNRDKKTLKRNAMPWRRSEKNNVAILAPRPSQSIEREVKALGKDNLLLESGDFRVLIATARQIPVTLMEIGRIREITFRSVGEGTGRSIDLDRFDDYYLHMFLWNERNNEIAGAYRLGLTDHILDRYGLKGLYTRMLFNYGNRFLDEIDPAIELGRSFIRPEYQKAYRPLLLLWQGIARFVYQNPRYKILFGPVSITRDYNDISIRLMVNYLKKNSYSHELGRLVRPANCVRLKHKGVEVERLISSISEVCDLASLVSDIEDDNKGIPVLLKHYLRMGARALAFNIDRKFSNVIDALIVVNLTETEKKMLERHMGKKYAEAFLNYHQKNNFKNCA